MGSSYNKRGGSSLEGLLWAHRHEADQLISAGHWLEAADRLEKIAFLTRYQEDCEIERLEEIYRKVGQLRSVSKLLKKTLTASLQSNKVERFFKYAARLAALCKVDSLEETLPEMLHDLDAMMSVCARQKNLDGVEEDFAPKAAGSSRNLKIGFTFGGSYFHPLPVEWYQSLLKVCDGAPYELFFYWLPNPEEVSGDQGLAVLSRLSLGSHRLYRSDTLSAYPRQITAMLKVLRDDALDCLVFHSLLFSPPWNYLAYRRVAPWQVALLAHCENSSQIDFQYLSERLLPRVCGPACGVESLGFPPGLLKARSQAYDQAACDYSMQALKQCAQNWLDDLRARVIESFPRNGKDALSATEDMEQKNNVSCLCSKEKPQAVTIPSGKDILVSVKEEVAEYKDHAGQTSSSSHQFETAVDQKREAEVILNQAIEALQHGDRARAQELLVKAQALHYPLMDLEYVRSMCHIQERRYDAAAEALAKELRYFPENTEAGGLYTKVLKRLGAEGRSS